MTDEEKVSIRQLRDAAIDYLDYQTRLPVKIVFKYKDKDVEVIIKEMYKDYEQT